MSKLELTIWGYVNLVGLLVLIGCAFYTNGHPLVYAGIHWSLVSLVFLRFEIVTRDIREMRALLETKAKQQPAEAPAGVEEGS